MPRYSCDDILHELTGSDGEWNEEYDQIDSENADFMTDWIEGLSPMQEVPSTFKPANIKVTLVPRRKDECIICLENTLATSSLILKCGHKLCFECAADYAEFQIKERSTIRRIATRLETVSPGHSFALRYDVECGVKCPYVGCSGIICAREFQSLVSHDAYQLFESIAVGQVMESEMKWLKPCPHRCGGVLQADCLCSNIDCRKRYNGAYKRLLYMKKELEAAKSLVSWAKTSGIVKCCPSCGVMTEKWGGCDHHYCTRCNTAYAWSTAPVFTQSNKFWVMATIRSSNTVTKNLDELSLKVLEYRNRSILQEMLK